MKRDGFVIETWVEKRRVLKIADEDYHALQQAKSIMTRVRRAMDAARAVASAEVYREVAIF